MYFSGHAEEIKEYSIAVHALGRAPDFEPQLDPIVRVSARSLRKRLEQYYREEGASHPIRLRLPVGHYAPRFVRSSIDGDALPQDSDNGSGECELSEVIPVGHIGGEPDAKRITTAASRSTRHRNMLIAALGLTLLGALTIGVWARLRGRKPLPAHAEKGIVAVAGNSIGAGTTPLLPSQSGGWHYLMDNRQGYTDSGGVRWTPAAACTGGTVYHEPQHRIAGTADQAIFQSGRQGAFACKFPVPPGVYEVHLLFADTSNSGPASRWTSLSMNGAATVAFDIANEAQGDNREVVKVFPGVHPEDDGAIHLNFLGDQSFLSGVEILPGVPDGRMLPLRISASPFGYTDRQGQHWLPVQYVIGGSRNTRSYPTLGAPDPGLFQWERFGHMHFSLPVAAGQSYTLRLYFSEGWFGPHKWTSGGVGSRVFDVLCNGQMLLRNFDILAETTPEREAVVKTFHHVTPTTWSTIELGFYPVRDYPVINAIEVLPETNSNR